ncbi:hypothetical protein [Specibacter sp. RAF43]|uniref:hypothetical protein n=1 Tax=Specibacter sp. RAF43 TaxID=3233057 RepID=UPI003F9C5806
MVEQEDQWIADPAGVYFRDRFKVDRQVLEDWGAFDISVVSEFPVFIDGFPGRRRR